MGSMMRRMVVVLVLLGCGSAAMAAVLQVGDPAPPLGERIEWLKGEPVDLAKGVGKEIYVLEFWATWCMPCIVQMPHTTELQKKYRSHGVRFVAVTSPGGGWQRQRPEDVREFVKNQGDKMGFTVGFDPTDKTDVNYMLAAEQAGIPYAFIIGREGRILWHGHPDNQMEGVLEAVVAGKFDVAMARAAAEVQRKIDALTVKFNQAVNTGKWEEGLAVLGEMVKVDPSNGPAIEFSLRILASELKDHARMRMWAERYINEHSDSVMGLTLVAEVLIGLEVLSDRQPDLALRAAVAACAADTKSAAAMRTQARVWYRLGRVDLAIVWQEKAVQAAASEADRSGLQATLDYYRQCKKLGES